MGTFVLISSGEKTESRDMIVFHSDWVTKSCEAVGTNFLCKKEQSSSKTDKGACICMRDYSI